jgi:hypothetical protein
MFVKATGPKPFFKLVKLRPSLSNPISLAKTHGKTMACVEWTRCEGDISPGVISIDIDSIDSVVLKIRSKLAPVQTGMKTIRLSKLTAS